MRAARRANSRDASSPSHRVTQLANLPDQIATTERRLTEIDSELTALRANQFNESEVTHLLAHFTQTWDALAPRYQARVIELLIERIDYRGQDGQISLTFRPSGIRSPLELPINSMRKPRVVGNGRAEINGTNASRGQDVNFSRL